MSGYNEMLQKYRDVDEDEIMSGLTKDELARLENEIDREILEKPPDCTSADSESYTTASSSSDEEDCEEIHQHIIEEDVKKDIVDTVQSQPKPYSPSKSKPEAFARGKLDKTQLKPIQKSLIRQKSKEKNTFKLPQLRKTASRNDRKMSGDDGNNTLKNELFQAVKKREGKRRTRRGNSSGVNKRPSYVSSKARRNSKIITRYRDGNEHQVDAAVVNRNFMTDELMNLRPRLRKIHVKEPKLVLPDELHGVSFDRITAGARRKHDDGEGEIEDVEQEQAVSEDGDASRNSAFGYDADIDVTPSDDSCLPGEDECQPTRRKAMSESSDAPSEGVAAMASTASTSAESCDVFAGELSINPTSVEEMVERIRENDPTLVEVNLNNIHDVPIERFEELAEAMEDNTRVTSLFLANTGLTDRAAKALAAMLKKNQTLKKLNVESNFITGKWPCIRRDIRNFLSQDATIEKAIDYCCMTKINMWPGEGGRRLVSALRKNNCLVELSLDNQRHIFGAKAEQDMSKMLKENTSLLKLGYQFANPGLRMATSNILTKNMDLVRRKRVAEEKKRQGGQHKRPQLRRQPSSEWYRKERLEKLKKLQEHSKMLGLDPSKRIGENDVARVLQNMSKDEVSLLERWFTSKLLGAVDKPPTSTQQEDTTASANTHHEKGAKKRSDDTKTQKSKNFLNPPSRTKRSKSPVANRDDLLDSIRKSSPNLLRKVKPGSVRPPIEMENTDSEAEMQFAARKGCGKSDIVRQQDERKKQQESVPNESRRFIADGNQTERGRVGCSVPDQKTFPVLEIPVAAVNPQETASKNIAKRNLPAETKATISKMHDMDSDTPKVGGGLDTCHILPEEKNVGIADRCPSPEVREWKEGEDYDSDEYEVVEVEVTDSEGESESETLRDSSQLGTNEKCSSTRVEADKDNRRKISDRITLPKYTTLSGANFPSTASNPTSPQYLSLDTNRKPAYDSDRSNPQSPISPRYISTSPLPRSKSRVTGDVYGSDKAQHGSVSPQSSVKSSMRPTTPLASSSRRSPVDRDVKPEALSTINSFFNFK